MARYSFLFILLIGLFSSCKSDDPSEEKNNFEFTTPLLFGDNFTIPSDNPMSEAGIELGRKLFYETLISKDSSISCSSCHKQEFCFSDGGKKFSTGTERTEGDMHSMTIVNTLWQNEFFWDGRAISLEDQALKPISNPIEMNLSINDAVKRLQAHKTYPALFEEVFGSNTIDSTMIARALAQFERTLISGESKFDKYKRGEAEFTEQEKRGEELFFTHPDPLYSVRGGNCGDCHSGFLTQANTFSNNGLDESPEIGRMAVTKNQNDIGKFKIPSLRNIEHSAPYMHDGRFATLEEVLEHYNEHIQSSSTLDPLIIESSNSINSKQLDLTEKEREDIVVFLKTLTDNQFLNNEKFSKPLNND